MDFDKAYKLIIYKLNQWVTDFIQLLPNLLLATLAFAVGIFIAKKLEFC